MTSPGDRLNDLREVALGEVLEMFHGDKAEMDRWLSSPCVGLGNNTPSKCLETRSGIHQVRTLVARLQNGIIT
ncbi:DUF2384 domain-containing protein [Marinobacter salsuginis]|uniref:antitoxin Xre/MbcA/ParS toxin-binding domain-containing protein n=1 Tax=Marinobacter salsuginis TaxID=418719 RepID=UPI001C96247D|nr:DUF2384 domain-containing protein [Marinobacter salsuginis]